MTKEILLTIRIIVSFSLLLTACNKLGPKHPQSVQIAAQELRRIQALLEVGIDFEKYDFQVREANVAVSEASAELPNGELRKELNATIEAYRDAHSVWAYQNDNSARLMQDSPLGNAMIAKYSLQTYEMYPSSNTAESNVVLMPSAENPLYANVSEARSKMWHIAREHLERVNELLKT